MASVSLDQSVFHLVVAAGTNATLIAVSPTDVPTPTGVRLTGWYIYNNTTAMRKIAFHDTNTTPTAGADVKFAICIPPNSGANVGLVDSILFALGLAITTVTGIGDSDTTGVGANDLNINLFYR